MTKMIRMAACKRCKTRVPVDQTGRLWAHAPGPSGRWVHLCGQSYGGAR